MIKIYCDESCHLRNDNSNVMALGAIYCPERNVDDVKNTIRKLKKEYDFDKKEIKWAHIKKEQIDMYKKLINYFYDSKILAYRAVVISNKKDLVFKDDQAYDDWYYKMYYYLLNFIVMRSADTYEIFVDRKDTNGREKINKLKDILCSSNHDSNIVNRIVEVDSESSDLVQLADFFTGLITYYRRGLHLNPNSSATKTELVKYLAKKFNIKSTNYLSDAKFNIFYWKEK